MYISKIQVKNYFSFRDSGEARFQAGINIITGQNSAGKTALMKALAFELDSEPHKSESTILEVGDKPEYLQSEVFLSIAASKAEVINYLSVNRDSTILELPIDRRTGRVIHGFSLEDRKGTHEIDYSLRTSGRGGSFHSLERAVLRNSFGLYFDPSLAKYGQKQRQFHKYAVTKDQGLSEKTGSSTALRSELWFESRMLSDLASKTYRFDAERLNISESSVGMSRDLASNARNLPEVIQNLQSDIESFREYNELVSTVLPHIRSVRSVNRSNSTTEIEVSSIDPARKRFDLTVPLRKCGTGVSQVLAMLYVVYISQTPKVLVIDEPSSFLHPAATKALIEIFKQHDTHQYFIGTHDPIVVSTADPDTIMRVVFAENNQESIFVAVDPDEAQERHEMLADIGVGLADVFGAETVLWVEGQTEERCFPILLRYAGSPLYRTSFLRIYQTSDLDRKEEQLKRIVETYRRMSKGGKPDSLYPPALGFFVDREERSNQKITSLKRLEAGKIEFTKFRHYENYLLDAEAITQVLNAADPSGETRANTAQVETWLEQNKNSFMPSKSAANETRPWYGVVDAAKLLKHLFQELSENRLEYKKTRHSEALTRWLLNNKPDHPKDFIQELTSFIEQCEAYRS